LDEAGRGPVIGCMVMAGAMMKDKDIHEIEALGVKDSKLLTPSQREAIYEKLVNLPSLQWNIRIVSAKEIDDAVESKNFNLNWLEALKSAEIINTLNPDKAFIDCPDPNTERHEMLLKIFG